MTPSPDLRTILRHSVTPRGPSYDPRNQANRQQERGFDSLGWRYQTPEAMSGFLGPYVWLLEAASLLPETFQRLPGARGIPGPKRLFLATDRALKRNVARFLDSDNG